MCSRPLLSFWRVSRMIQQQGHAYYAGETFRKSALVVNDTSRPKR
jgi:hypothetical protein